MPSLTASPTRTLTPEPSRTPTPTPTPTPTFTPVALTYGPKGIGDAWQPWATPGGGANLLALQYDWYYDWSAGYLPLRSGDRRYARMVWCEWNFQIDVTGRSRTLAQIAHDDFITNRRGRVWLVYNEPDDPNQCGGRLTASGLPMLADPAFAARRYVEVYDEIKSADPYARIYAGGLVWLSAPETQGWWQVFVQTLADAGALGKLDGVHIHLYPGVTTSTVRGTPDFACLNDRACVPALARAADAWYHNYHAGLGLGDRPIWISEIGLLQCGPEASAQTARLFMRPMIQWFTGEAWPYGAEAPANPGYASVAWYVTQDPGWFPCTYLLTGAGRPSGLGRIWNEWDVGVDVAGPGVE